MSDYRTIDDCPDENSCTHIALAIQEIRDLGKKVDALERKVNSLNDWVHTTKGALIVINLMAGAFLAALIAWVIKRL